MITNYYIRNMETLTIKMHVKNKTETQHLQIYNTRPPIMPATFEMHNHIIDVFC